MVRALVAVNDTKLGMSCALITTMGVYDNAPFRSVHPCNLCSHACEADCDMVLSSCRLAAILADSIDDGVLRYVVNQNASYAHSVPVYVNVMNDALLKNVTQSELASITTANAPLPRTLLEMVRALLAARVCGFGL